MDIELITLDHRNTTQLIAIGNLTFRVGDIFAINDITEYLYKPRTEIHLLSQNMKVPNRFVVPVSAHTVRKAISKFKVHMCAELETATVEDT